MSSARGQFSLERTVPTLVHIGTMLKELTSLVDDVTVRNPDGKPAALRRNDADVAVTATMVCKLIETRKERGAHFPKNWFSDPAWDVLLFLYRSHLSGDYITVGDISTGTENRPTTTIRWLDIIESGGFITRQRCKFDSRRVYIKLSLKGCDAMNNYFMNISAMSI